jgi:hypothetical protein
LRWCGRPGEGGAVAGQAVPVVLVRLGAAACCAAPGRGLALGAEQGDLGLEVLERLEGPVDAGEAQVGDLVELAQRAQDRQPDVVRVDLGAAAGADDVLDRWASSARSSSLTGRPWQALRTPA